MSDNPWKRYKNFEKCILFFLMFNLVFDIINKKILNSIVPIEIIGYLFWLSLGLFLGFQICKYEFKKVWKLQTGQEKKEEDKKMPSGLSPN